MSVRQRVLPVLPSEMSFPSRHRSATILVATGLFGVTACHRNDRTITFRVTNDASKTVAYVAFSEDKNHPSGPPFRLAKGDSFRTVFPIVGKSDGAYWMWYQFAGSTDTLTQALGYYSNGAPLEKELRVTIGADAVVIRRVPLETY
jgi:hypothetical protein